MLGDAQAGGVRSVDADIIELVHDLMHVSQTARGACAKQLGVIREFQARGMRQGHVVTG